MRIEQFSIPAVPTIVIIGGGFSGTMVAAQLLRQATGPLVIKLIERHRRQLHRGIAYSTPADSHLLNVPAGNMSAYAEDPEHFLHWANSQRCTESSGSWSRTVAPRSYLPRKLYGEYLHWTLEQAAIQSLPDVRLEIVHDEAVDIHPMLYGASVKLKSGEFIDAQHIVLALGNFPPSNPQAEDRSFYSSPRYLSDPWKEMDEEAWATAESCLIVGSGLSMVDWVLQLEERGYAGTVHVVSRRGLKPNANAVARKIPSWLSLEFDRPNARKLVRSLRDALSSQPYALNDWRDFVDAIRPHTAMIWRSLGTVEQQRFLRHLRPLWDNLRHRIAPIAAVKLEQLEREGRLIYHRGRIQSYSESAGKIAVKLRPHGENDSYILHVDRVINCTGMECDYRKIRHALIENLLAHGTIQPDALSLGLLTNSSGALIDTTGLASEILFTLGPPLRGALWETTAVPEIREQARRLAGLLLQKTVAQSHDNLSYDPPSLFNQSSRSA